MDKLHDAQTSEKKRISQRASLVSRHVNGNRHYRPGDLTEFSAAGPRLLQNMSNDFRNNIDRVSLYSIDEYAVPSEIHLRGSHDVSLNA